MTFKFKKQLRQGEIGEAIFYMAHQGTLSKEDGRARDFSCALTGAGVELKTDFYNMDATPFFFMERFSNREKQSPGGPYQAQANGTKWFVYFFISHLTYFRFETEKLVERLEQVMPTCEAMEIKNDGYVTVGYKVPREALSDLYQQMTLTVSVKDTSTP
jgi:hypothetical protein